MKPEHLDETGAVCTRHPVNVETLLTYAAIGSRVSSFNHDIASKLQGMMMALDELQELMEQAGGIDLREALDTAQTSLKDASALLQANRALTRPGTKTTSSLRDIVVAAGARVAVNVRGHVPDGDIETCVPLLAQAFCLVFDALAGTGRGRGVDIEAQRLDQRMTFAISSDGEPGKTLGDALALASFVIANAGGELRCDRANRLHVRLPLAG